VRIDKEKCNGSGKCIEKCTYNVIQFDDKERFAHKCNLCYDRVIHGMEPVCVDTCLTDALSFGEREILLMHAEAAGKEVIKRRSAQSILYVKNPV
jgi:polysulfide reductase chain B